MNDTNWIEDHTTAAALGGLTAEEKARFESSAGPDAKKTAEELRAVDASLRDLFSSIVSGNVEVASVNRLRQDWTRVTMERGWQRKLAFGLAASVGLGLTGAGVSMLGGLPMPGSKGFFAFDSKPIVPFIMVDGEDGSAKKTNNFYTFSKQYEQTSQNNINAEPVTGRHTTRGIQPQLAKPGEEMAQEMKVKLDDAARDGFGNTPRFGLPALSTSSSQNGQGQDNTWRFKTNTDAPTGKDLDKLSFFRGGNEDGISNQLGLNFGSNGYADVSKNRGDVVADKDGKALKGIAQQVQSGSSGKLDEKLGRIPSKGKEAEILNKNVDSISLELARNDPQNPTTGTSINPPPAGNQAPARKVIIRSGEIEFEVESFDSSVAAVSKLSLGINGAFVSTVNSEKMANGKVKGSVVVRVPPESLDQFVSDLRRDLTKGGELKGQRIGSQDITKQYTDLESRLRAARTMETRLLEIIKTGKGEIKQLLEAEKELGVWRTKIEEIEGELRFYSSQASLSTLTITIAEKEIRQAASLTETEKFSAGIEVDDVEKAYRALQKAVADAKGRVLKAEMKQHAAGQFSAGIVFEVSHEAMGPMRDRLNQIGNVARITSEQVQSSDGQPVTREAKIKRGDALFDVQLYNLTNVQPRETTTLNVAVPNVADAYAKIRDAVIKSGGRILTANLNEQDKKNILATVDFEVKRQDEGIVKAVFESAGEITSRQNNRAVDGLVTDSKILYRTTIFSTDKITPRERITLVSEVSDADSAIAVMNSHVNSIGGLIIDETSSRDRGKVSSRVIYQVPLTAAVGLTEKVKSAGILRVSNSTRDNNATDGKFAIARFDVSFSNEDRIVAPDDGIWPQVRKGLSYSASVLLTSVTWLVFGLCVVVPWVVLGYGGYRLFKRMSKSKVESAV